MSVSAEMFETLRSRGDIQEIIYYRERCLRNANSVGSDDLRRWEKQRENFIDQAHRLDDLIEQIVRRRNKNRVNRRASKKRAAQNVSLHR